MTQYREANGPMRDPLSKLVILYILAWPLSLETLAAPAPTPSSNETVIDSIRTLQRTGRFADAIPLAEGVLAALESDPSCPSYEMVEAKWRLRTLRTVAALPAAIQARMAQVEVWIDEYEALMKRRKYDEANDVLAHVIQVQETVLGSDHPETAWTLVALARVNRNRERFAAADSLLQRALAIQKNTLGEKHPNVPSTLTSLGRLYLTTGALERAESHARRALALRLDIFGDTHRAIASALGLLGSITNQQKDFAAAEAYHRRSLAIYRRAGDSMNLVIGSFDFASLLTNQGDYTGAIETYEELLAELSGKYGKDHFYVGLTSLHMAIPRTSLGQYERAETLIRDALRIFRPMFGDEHDQVALASHNLSDLLTTTGDYEEADSLLATALAISEKNHPGGLEVARSLLGYGVLRAEQARYPEARRYLEQAGEIYEKRVGRNDPRYGLTRRNLAQALIEEGNYKDARPILADACRTFEETRKRVSYESLGRAAVAAEDSPYRMLAAVELQLARPERAWTAVEKDCARAMLDLLVTKSLRRLTPDEEREEARLDEALTRLEEAALAVANDGAGPSSADSVEIALEEARARWLKLQQELAHKYPLTEGSSYELPRIQSNLTPGSALVGWLDLHEHHYVYMIRPTGAVVWKKLHEPDEKAVERFRQLVSTPGTDVDETKRLGRLVYRHRLEPLADELAEVDRLCVIPSGPLLGLPLEALPVGDDKTAADLWEISYAPSATVFAWLRTRPATALRPSLLGLGDPPFNDDHARAMQARERPPERVAVTRGGEWDEIYRGAARGERTAVARLPRLGGTRKELEQIAALFPSSNILLGQRASERVVHQLATGGKLVHYSYLHLATHAIPDNLRGERSALILSQADSPGGLSAIASGERLFDGRLTMDEIMREWRLDAELVTLSACETALGQAQRGEGYIGFAHAFFRAGTRSLLVSLWKVSDRATRLLMTRFYENMIAGGTSKSASLRDAKLWLRDFKSESGRTPYKHPSYWAGFVLIGDPD